MQASISSFSPTAELPTIFKTYTVIPEAEQSWSITLRKDDGNTMNANILETLMAIGSLAENWDEEGAKPPAETSVQMAKGIIYFMSAIGQEIYNIAPGPKGEILIDFRNNSKSLELLIYSDKMVYVKFDDNGTPFQDKFTPDLLHTHLIAWLNS